MELVLGKSYYTTEYVEEEALNFLKEYQPDKYLNAIVVDKPDI